MVAVAERKAKVIALRRDQRLTMRAIAALAGCSHETVRRDINQYIRKLDSACLEGVDGMRAEEYERLDNIACRLDVEIAKGDLSLIPAALKTSAEIRKLYALDVQPLGRTELALRRAVITEIATKLRDQLPPETFADVAVVLTADEPIQLLGDVAVADGDAEASDPPRQRRPRQGAAQGPGSPTAESWGLDAGSDEQPPALVDLS